MANINLNNYFRKENDIKSPVDSKIKLNKAISDKEYWGDLRLDVQAFEIKERSLNAKISTKDLQRIINEESVIISLRNLFNTHSCSRLLNPEINFSVSQYLFEPLTEAKAFFLGYDLLNFFPLYEPRVRVSHVHVVANIEKNVYEITIKVQIPNVSGDDFEISSILSKDGYSILL